MTDEKREKDQPVEEPAIIAHDTPDGQETPPIKAEEKKASGPPEISQAQRRGRMVSAGMLTAVIASLVVVVTAGIFHLVAGTLKTCPKDLPVNDPAPILWQKIEAAKLGDQALGVTGEMLAKTGLKAEVPPEQESKDKAKDGESGN